MPRKKPTRKDNRYEYKITLGRDIHGKPLRKSFYSTVSLADAKKKAEEFRVASVAHDLQAAVCQPQYAPDL